MMNLKSKKKLAQKIHIISQKDGKWIIKGKSKLRASAIAHSEIDAVILGKEISRNQNSELYILKENKLVRIKPEVIPKRIPYSPYKRERTFIIEDY